MKWLVERHALSGTVWYGAIYNANIYKTVTKIYDRENFSLKGYVQDIWKYRERKIPLQIAPNNSLHPGT